MLHLMEASERGGMERLLLAYLTRPYSAQDAVLAVNRGGFGSFLGDIQANAIAFRKASYIGPLRLPERPKRIRQAWVNHCMARHRTAVFWNRLPDRYTRHLRGNGGVRYYDHGLAWFRPPDWQNINDRFDRVIACSYASARMLRLHWGFRGEVAICPNPAIRHASSAKSATWNGRGEFTIGVASRLNHAKGISLAIDALAILQSRKRPCRLLVAGDGPAASQLHEQAHALGVSQSIDWLGHISDPGTFYPRIHCLVHPTLADAGSLTIREASAAGCPVVATRIDGMPEWFEDSSTAKLITPDMPLSEYAAEHAEAPLDLPPACYDYDTDTLVQPKAPRPAALADAIREWYDWPESHRLAVLAAGALIASKGISEAAYTSNLEEILRETL